MASVTKTQNTPQNPNDILSEIRHFIKGVVREELVSQEDLLKSGLYLLQTLPAARHAVLEYLGNVFDEAVNTYLLKLELGNNLSDESNTSFESVIADSSEVLLNFVNKHPTAWAPLISAWSLELLGHTSTKYAGRRSVPHSGNLNEQLQLWMSCPATKTLIGIATECFASMVSGAPDICVDALLEASVKYTPYFDWVVAHIGSCFPTTIITRVLMCGLKDFSIHGNNQSEASMASEEKIPKMASVVGILGHLASKHGSDIEKALMTLFQDSLEGSGEGMKLLTTPFLLHLASMSSMLLHILTTDFVNLLSPSVLNKLSGQFYRWDKSIVGDNDSLLALGVHLVMRTGTGAGRLVNFLLDVAFPTDKTKPDSMDCDTYCREIRQTCQSLLDQLCLDLQRAVYGRRPRDEALDIPLLSALSSSIHNLTKNLLTSAGQRAKWLERLITYVSVYSGADCASSALSKVLAEADTPDQLLHLIQLQQDLEGQLPSILNQTINMVMGLLQTEKHDKKARLLTNLLCLLQWEERYSLNNDGPFRNTVSGMLPKHILVLTSLICSKDHTVGMTALNILCHIGVPPLLSHDVLHTWSTSMVTLFFATMQLRKKPQMIGTISLCKKCMKELANSSVSQAIMLMALIEGALYPEHTTLFGGKPELPTPDRDVSLLAENKKHDLSLTLPQSHSSVFHAGIIGHGLKPRTNKQLFTAEELLSNKSVFLDVLRVCCVAEAKLLIPAESAATDKATKQNESSVMPSISSMPDELGKKIAEHIVSLVTPDVLYNGILWPEEECIKSTIERDLYVRKCFDKNPVLWDILDLLSENQSFVCYMSPALRSLTATVTNHFEKSRDSKTTNWPKQMDAACRIIGCLNKGNQLPRPLRYVGELIPYLCSHEAHLLMVSVWRYTKENPPRIDRVSIRIGCDLKYLEIMRSILQANIHQVGHMYARCFALDTTPVEIS